MLKIKPCINIGSYLVCIILAVLLFKSCHKEPETKIVAGDRTVVVKLVTKIDTVHVPHNVVEHRLLEQPTLIQTDTIHDIHHKVVTIPAIKRVYQDSTKVEDSVYVGYKANTTGTLDKINLTYSNHKSIVVIHKTDSVYTNITITKPSKGLYLGLDAGKGELSPTLLYNVGKNNYGVKYNIINQGIGITYSRKLL